MKKTFVIQVEYPDCDFVSSEEIAEVTQECIEHHIERYFGENIMDGDYDRIKVKEVTDELTLVKKMREAQKEWESQPAFKWGDTDLFNTLRKLEREVDEYLKEDGYMTKKEWKIGDVGYFFYTYLWQTMKATVTMTTNDYLVVTDEFGHIHRVEKEDFYKTEEEVELSL